MTDLELARYERGLTLPAAAETLRVTVRRLRRWELRESRVPADMAPTVARLYGVSVAELLGVTTSDLIPVRDNE
jgi:transcriptional regulator with XRE-family HTH domain